jgi:hypothetical protein
MGWGVLPLWVGPQSPCIANSSNYWILDSSTATSRGTSEADQAVQQATWLGISSGIIYYDMEGYTPDGGTCSNTVRSFLSAWNSEIHTKGFKAGLYGSLEDFETDFLQISPISDAVWIAAWDSNNTVLNLGTLPNSDWNNNQRIHQWKNEGAGETWGQSLISNIDVDVVDAPVVGGTTAQAPTITTGSPSAITANSATVAGTINPNGLDTHFYVLYGTSSTLSGAIQTSSTDLGSGTTATNVTGNLTGLNSGTLYYYQWAASNNAGTTYGTISSFTTTAAAQAPTITTGSTSSITASSATLAGTVNPNGLDTHFYALYGTSSTLSGAVQTTSVDLGSGTSASNVSGNLTGLNAGTLYYFQWVASNSAGTTHGTINSFTTSAAAQAPTAASGSAASVTTNSATLGGTVNPNGADTHYWFLYGTSSTLSGASQTSSQDLGSGTTASVISANISGLSAGTQYYWEVVAQNSTGTTNGAILSFATTTAVQNPTVLTGSASTITSTSATLSGTVTPNGADTNAWFLYGTSSTLSGATTTSSQDLGSGTTATPISANISGLNAGTLYYYRVSAGNSAGSGNGNIYSFTTTAAQAPTVSTGGSASITSNSASVGGTVNPNGSDTKAWFQYATNNGFTGSSTTGQQDLASGTSNVAFNASLSGLTSNTLYYFRAVASNSGGTINGSTASFTTTSAAQAPTAASGSATSVTTNSATLGGTVNPNGADTHYWFLYGTSSTLSGASQTSSQDLGSGTTASVISANISGLSAGTQYYWEVVAQNSAGTTNGTINSFTTTSAGQAPTVSTGGSASITSSGASVGGTVNPNGADTQAWFQYATNSSLTGASTTTQQDLGSGTSNVAYNAPLSGLSANTLYYFRAVASNSIGTTNGSTASFTTSAAAQAPTASTGGSASITSSGASVGGTVNPNGADTHAWFQYATNSSLTGASTTTQQDLGSGTSNVAYNASLSGLSANTLYYFRAVASNSTGTTNGSTASFTTSASAQAPTVSTGGSASITSSGASIGGTVNPNGADTQAWFQYATNSSLTGASTTTQQDLGSGTSNVAYNAPLSGLSANTLYYFRAVASNSTGTTNGSTASFTTSAAAKTTPTVTVVPTPASITTAQQLSVAVTVNATSGNPTPTGSVVLVAGTGSFNGNLVNGVATIPVPAGTFAAGTDQLTATYTPDTTSSSVYNSATGTGSVIVTAPAKTTPTVTVVPTPASITTAQQLSVAVTVNATSGNPTPTGSVVLVAGTGSFNGNLVNGVATIPVPAGTFAAGTDQLTATYTPDTTSSSVYNSATGSGSVIVTAPAKTTPTVTVVPTPASITTAQQLSVAVTVNATSGNPTPTGSVVLVAGTGSFNGNLVNGVATIPVPAGTFAAGTDQLTATYTPDTTSSSVYNSATGTAAVTVTTAVGSSFTISGAAVTIAKGATTGNTSTITVTPAGGFTGSVALGATVTSSPSGAQDLPALSFGSTSPVTITGASAVTATLTISTTAATSGALTVPKRPGVRWTSAGGAVFACLLLFVIPVRRRRLGKMLGVLVFFAILTGGFVGCGGGGSKGGGTGNPGTTAGNYTVTVTAISGNTTTQGTVSVTVQ